MKSSRSCPTNDACHHRWLLPSPGIACATSPATGLVPWRGPQTWRSTWRPRSYSAWWSTGRTCWRAPGHRTRCTACGSWLWRGRKSTAYPRKRSVRGRDWRRGGEGGGLRKGESHCEARQRWRGSPAGRIERRRLFLWWITEPLPSILPVHSSCLAARALPERLHFLLLSTSCLLSLAASNTLCCSPSASTYLVSFFFNLLTHPWRESLFASANKKSERK